MREDKGPFLAALAQRHKPKLLASPGAPRIRFIAKENLSNTKSKLNVFKDAERLTHFRVWKSPMCAVELRDSW